MTKKLRKKVRRVPATTNNLQRAIIVFLNNKGHYAFRVNNGAVYDPVKKIFRKRRKDDPEISDVHCTLRPSGVSLWIEVKNAYTRDRVRKGQRDFAKHIQDCGGIHLFATTYENFLQWYEDNVFDNIVIEYDTSGDPKSSYSKHGNVVTVSGKVDLKK